MHKIKPETVKIRPLAIYEKQRQILRSTAPIKGFIGGRGTGKTKIGVIDILLRARNAEPWMAVSPDYNVIMGTTLVVFEEVATTTRQLIRIIKSPTPKAYFRTHDGGKAEVVFKSAEKPDKLRGFSNAGLWFDEATVMKKEAFLFAYPTLRFRGRLGPCLITATPKGTRHWTFETFFTPITEEFAIANPNPRYLYTGGRFYAPKKGTELVRSRSIDNPFLPPQYDETNRAQYSTMLAEQEFGGEFVDIAGLMFRREWFPIVNQAPRVAVRVRYWDRAATPGSGCFTAGVLMARDRRGLWYVEDVVRGQWSAHERNEVMRQTAILDKAKYGGEVIIFTETEGGSAGKEVSEQLLTMFGGFPMYTDNVGGGKQFRSVLGEKLPGQAKIVRAFPFQAQAEAGNVRVVRGAWNEAWFTELIAFPEYKFMDQVDGTTGAFNKLAQAIGVDAGQVTALDRQVNTDSYGALAMLQRNMRQ